MAKVDIIGNEVKVLDHGWIRVVDAMGEDGDIVSAARVSYGSGTKTVREDQGLINYLMRHDHSGPFEQCEIKLMVKLPIFVARQWVRHRTASLNECSARYSVMPNEFYVPEPKMVQNQSLINNQGRAETLPIWTANDTVMRMREVSANDYGLYEGFLGVGVARELARIILPLNTYTEWYWKIDLHNLFHFLKLRCDQHAQYEIRIYAEEILKIVEQWVPMSAAAFKNYQLEAFTLSRDMIDVLKRWLPLYSYTIPEHEVGKLSKREAKELRELFYGNMDC